MASIIMDQPWLSISCITITIIYVFLLVVSRKCPVISLLSLSLIHLIHFIHVIINHILSLSSAVNIIYFGLQSFCILIISIFAADTASSILHWTFETYGTRHTMFIGPTIDTFRTHHAKPYRIWHRNVWSVNHELCRAMLVLQLLCSGYLVVYFRFKHDKQQIFFYLLSQPFIILFAFCNQFHKWSHAQNQCHLPRIIRLLQNYKLILSHAHHHIHHIPPHQKHYAIITGWSDHILDNIHFYRLLKDLVDFIHDKFYHIIIVLYVIVGALSWILIYDPSGGMYEYTYSSR